MGRILVLFSGTNSIEKVFNFFNNECRGVDIDKRFEPYYNVDILTWDYKKELKEWRPDYIHASPVCTEFSKMKNINTCEGHKRDLKKGTEFVLKTLEIIEYCKGLNKDLKYTIENPKGIMRKLDIMKKYKMVETSYCKYDYPYKKDTDFWFGGFELKLKHKCCKNHLCNQIVKKKHKVRIGAFKKEPGQMRGIEYFKILRNSGNYPKYSKEKYFRYRIPEGLVKDIYISILKHII